MTEKLGTIWLRHGRTWRTYTTPKKVYQTHTLTDIPAILQEIETAVEEQNLTAVGFVSYEAAPAFDGVLVTHETGDFPLLWFGLYEKPTLHEQFPANSHPYKIGDWQAAEPESHYKKAIHQIKNHIARGDTYQVNYTYRLRTSFTGNPFAFFTEIDQAQQSSYSAYINLGRYVICSASPELFFTRDGEQLTAKPMKGTVKRGFRFEDDERNGRWLAQSKKNRAENVMIVDMIRNDLNRIAAKGSVQTPHLFQVTQYPTLWQMTSTVQAKIPEETTLQGILEALFPCASITGAPKVSTMKIINELEPEPRGVYCGAIGFYGPNQQAQFNVAIRTVTIDTEKQQAEYGVGGGIVWDSETEDEYAECQTKAAVLTAKRPPFELLETILWEPGKDYFALKRHLGRMVASADYFGYPIKVGEVIDLLYDLSDTFTDGQHKRVRLLLAADGFPRVESYPHTPDPDKIWKLALASEPVNSQNIFLYHKTTHRDVYAPARAELEQHGADDMILWNERGELTETTIGNIVLKLNGRWVTPPISSGLLGGVYRARLFGIGSLREQILTKDDLHRAEEIAMINSVRKWCRAVLVS